MTVNISRKRKRLQPLLLGYGSYGTYRRVDEQMTEFNA